MKNHWILIILIFILLFIGLLYYAEKGHSIRFLNDPCDRKRYHDEGMWYPLKKVPYKDIGSEYPQLAVCLFAVPHVLLSLLRINYTVQGYSIIFSAIMLIFFLASVILLYRLRRDHRYFALAMFLPASLYFSLYRYDIFPVFLSLLSVKFLSENRHKAAILVLSLGILAKWYLLVLLPIFLSFQYYRLKKIDVVALSMFFLVIFSAVVTTFLTGGLRACLIPYVIQARRGCNAESFFYLLYLVGVTSKTKIWYFIFFMLQFAVMPLTAISKIDSFQKIIRWAALSILVFMLFAKFYSPQWILWVTPFLILRARNWKDIVPIALFDFATYFHFPIAYDGFKESLLTPACFIRTIFHLYFIAILTKELMPDIRASLIAASSKLREYKKMLIIFFSILLIAEVYLRYKEPVSIYVSSKNPELVYELNPAYPQVNSFGMRQDEFDMRDLSGSYVIAVIGDSHTFCSSVKDWHNTYPNIMENYLSTLNKDVKIKVLNFGVPGYNTSQEIELLKTRALRFNPNLIILQIAINDTHVCNYIQPENKLLNHMVYKSYILVFLWKRFIYSAVSEKFFYSWFEQNYTDALLFIEGLTGTARADKDRETAVHLPHPPRTKDRVPPRYHYMLGNDNWKKYICDFANTAKDHKIPLVATGFIEDWQREVLLNNSFKIYTFNEMFTKPDRNMYEYDPLNTSTHFNETGCDIIGKKLAKFIYPIFLDLTR
ncbi:MAG: GDSL-type esterase/lipase family protein [Candidatus Omnitrophica bacterium]|nr:GDSL-type esterase/lipase family protein [Candidatus Omnitrophota bacterium]